MEFMKDFFKSNLKKNEDDEWYECKIEINNESGFFCISYEEETDLEILSDKSVEICTWLQKSYEMCKAYSANELINLKNENWLKKDEESWRKDAFLDELKLEGVTVSEDYSFEVSYDNDVFWGNFVVVRIDSEYQFDEAIVQG